MKCKQILVSMVLLIVLIPLLSTNMKAGVKEKHLEKGKKIFEKVIAALGGAEKIKDIKNVSTKGVSAQLSILKPGEKIKMDSETVMEYPDKLRYTIKGTRGLVTIIINGDEGWMVIPPKPMEPMSKQDINSELAFIQRDPFHIYRNLHQYNIQWIGEKNVAGTMAIDLFLTGPTEFHLFIHPKTYLPVGLSYGGTVPNRPEPLERVEIHSDYKEVDGIKVAFKIILNEAGKKVMEFTLKEIKFNIKLEKHFFKVKETGE
ncbi:MAG: hypothetical protein JSV88_15650 [Candidatus Aminicenantes bacterium]|nr:MAG: hypothetical protein JSV88_15650 [Candidatus Aminicenantes bacterium]